MTPGRLSQPIYRFFKEFSMKIRRGRDFITEMRPLHTRGSAEPIAFSAHYLKPLQSRQRRLDAILELVARLAIRAALKQHETHVETSPSPSDSVESELTSG